MSTDEYVPDEQDLEVAWIEFEASADDINVASAEFDRFLARVRRDARRGAVLGAKAALLYAEGASPRQIAVLDHHCATHYPEETP